MAVEVYLLQKKLSSTMQISRGGFNVRKHCIVRIITDAGISGLGEGIGNADYVYALLNGPFKDKIIGLNPLDIQDIRNKTIENTVYYERKGSAICAASAIEMACWDIKGKSKNKSVWQLLGEKVREDVRVYASDVYWDSNVNKMLSRVDAILNLGINAIKAHIGVESSDKEKRKIHEIRKFAGDSAQLMLDINCGYQLDEALKCTKLWEEYNIFWIEEPIDPSNIEGLIKLKTVSNIPIAFGENEFLVSGFSELFTKNAIDYAMPDIGRCGGILEAKLICDEAKRYGIPCTPHNYSSGVLLAATMQLMAACKNADLLEYDASTNAIYHEFFIEPLVMNNGRLRIQDLPGLGVELKQEIIDQYAI